jgi:hypothetical protein
VSLLYRSLCLLSSATSFLCPYAGPTYSIVLTIVHFDGTSILSLHTTSYLQVFDTEGRELAKEWILYYAEH